MKPTSPHSRRSAFSLVELLVVMGLLCLLAVLALPAATAIQRSMNVTRGGQLLQEKLIYARQVAVSRGRAAEVRLYQAPSLAGGGNVYRALQVYLLDEKGANATPVDKLSFLPPGICISSQSAFSTLIDSAPHSGSQSAPALGVGATPYRAFRFTEGGGTDLDPGGPGGSGTQTWFATAHAEADAPSGSTPPRNFFTVQVDPVSGITSYFRP